MARCIDFSLGHQVLINRVLPAVYLYLLAIAAPVTAAWCAVLQRRSVIYRSLEAELLGFFD